MNVLSLKFPGNLLCGLRLDRGPDPQNLSLKSSANFLLIYIPCQHVPALAALTSTRRGALMNNYMSRINSHFRTLVPL